MKKIITLSLAVIILCLSANAETLAYWRFEEGSNGSTHTNNLDGYYVDSSGNGNDLSSWYYPAPVPHVPIATIPLSGVTNEIALNFCKRRAYDYPSIMCIKTQSKPIDSYDLTAAFTIECATKTLTRGWNTVLNKEGKPTAEANSPFKILYRDNPPYRIECDYIDAGGNIRVLQSTFDYEFDKWYWLAVVTDGTDVKLYIKEEGDANYDLEATVAGGSGLYNSEAAWTIACGSWAGGDTKDALYGSVDEVRICDTALDTNQFLAADGGSSVSPVAYWRFEEGTNGVHLGNNDDYYVDSSGNDNHMSTDITPVLSTATDEVPFSIIPQTDAPDTMARLFTHDMQNVGTFGRETGGKSLDSYVFTNDFTIELMARISDNSIWNVVLCKDGEPIFPAAGNEMSPLEIIFGADGSIGVYMFDSAKNFVVVKASYNYNVDEWYKLACVCKGGTDLKLYVAKESEEVYTLEDSATIVGGMVSTYAPWVVGRGMNHGDTRDGVDGIIDEVRISNSALIPEQFLGTVPEPGMIFGGIALALLAFRRK
ncbi:hypothetical protein KAH27_05125 [bacterium]|nr:hypothetical protein [bacterium]